MASQLHPRPLIRYRKPIKDEAYTKWVRTLACLICKPWDPWFGRYPVEAAHTRQEGQGGTGTKTDDATCIPLCGHCHRHGEFAYHAFGREEDWAAHHKLDLAARKAEYRRRYMGEDFDETGTD